MNCGNEMKMKKRRFCYIGCPLKSESLRVAYEFSDYLLIFCCNLEQNVQLQRWDSNPRLRRDWCLKPAP